MRGIIIIILTLACITACVTTSQRANTNTNRDASPARQATFVRYEGVKHKLYYPSNFYTDNTEQAQDRSARAWWNQ
ncbi:MAG: hypothetical protein P1U39_01240 [Legionellaceae bacterium]|nr:hypothetical protein [Legionellaceae bacterium]